MQEGLCQHPTLRTMRNFCYISRKLTNTYTCTYTHLNKPMKMIFKTSAEMVSKKASSFCWLQPARCYHPIFKDVSSWEANTLRKGESLYRKSACWMPWSHLTWSLLTQDSQLRDSIIPLSLNLLVEFFIAYSWSRKIVRVPQFEWLKKRGEEVNEK